MERSRPKDAGGKLQELYREAARKFHPDHAANDADRKRRTHLMAEANRAYESGDLEGLKALLRAHEGADPGAHHANPSLCRACGQVLPPKAHACPWCGSLVAREQEAGGAATAPPGGSAGARWNPLWPAGGRWWRRSSEGDDSEDRPVLRWVAWLAALFILFVLVPILLMSSSYAPRNWLQQMGSGVRFTGGHGARQQGSESEGNGVGVTGRRSGSGGYAESGSDGEGSEESSGAEEPQPTAEPEPARAPERAAERPRAPAPTLEEEAPTNDAADTEPSNSEADPGADGRPAAQDRNGGASQTDAPSQGEDQSQPQPQPE
ncbi:MAG TPA: hypothetical protein VGN26_23575 [Armatimonadota bacterium]